MNLYFQIQVDMDPQTALLLLLVPTVQFTLRLCEILLRLLLRGRQRFRVFVESILNSVSGSLVGRLAVTRGIGRFGFAVAGDGVFTIYGACVWELCVERALFGRLLA